MARLVMVLGDANVDLLIRQPAADAGDSMPAVAEPELTGGGTAANTAVALARMGTPTLFSGMVGDDGYGRFVEDDLTREGIDISGLCVDRTVFTPMVIAMIRPDGERTLVVWPPRGGAHTQLRPDHLDPRAIKGAAWLHTTGMCLRESPVRETVLHAMSLAHAADIPVSLDLNLRLELWGWRDDIRTTLAHALPMCTIVFGSADTEIAPLARMRDIEAAAHAVADGQRTVVARMGADGALVVAPDGAVSYAPAFPTTIRDTVGAGDAFNGGFIAAQIEGWNLDEALRWGNAVAALKIARSGARGLPYRTEVEHLLQY